MITFDDACYSLQTAGLEEGDVLFSHANFALFGRMETVFSAEDLFSFWMRVIRNVIGNEGTMVFPSFTYSFNSSDPSGVFDISRSNSNVSGLANYIMQHEDEHYRSMDPMLSVVAVGPHARFITEDIGSETFGEQSIWQRLYELNAKIVNFNIDSASTFLHWIERKAGVAYRTDIPMTGTIINHNGDREVITIKYFGRKNYNDPSTAEDFQEYHKEAISFGIVKHMTLGRGIINLSNTKDVAAFTLNQIKLTNNFLTAK